MTETATKEVNRELRFYHPKNDGNGGASKFQLRLDTKAQYPEYLLFWTAAKQIPSDDDNAKFDWDNGVVIKLDTPDIGDLLAVLKGYKLAVGPEPKEGQKSSIFHKNASGNTSLTFSAEFNNKDRLAYYAMRLAKKRDNQVTEAKHVISIQEAMVLEVLLTKALHKFYGWD